MASCVPTGVTEKVFDACAVGGEIENAAFDEATENDGLPVPTIVFPAASRATTLKTRGSG